LAVLLATRLRFFDFRRFGFDIDRVGLLGLLFGCSADSRLPIFFESNSRVAWSSSSMKGNIDLCKARFRLRTPGLVETTTMKAFCASKYGSMDYFGIRETAKPAPKENQVLVKVHAVSINDWDWGDLGRITKGHWLVRLQFGWSKPKKIVGSDIAGRVESVGRDVTRFKTGDAVFGDLSRYFGSFGGFAEYVCRRTQRENCRNGCIVMSVLTRPPQRVRSGSHL
jgi:alcohol dehydrogenase-like protein